jgi:hypothetical protein
MRKNITILLTDSSEEFLLASCVTLFYTYYAQNWSKKGRAFRVFSFKYTICQGLEMMPRGLKVPRQLQ